MGALFAQDDWEIARGCHAEPRRALGRRHAHSGRPQQHRAARRLRLERRQHRQDGDSRQHRHLLRHARIVAHQPRVELRPGRPGGDRPAAGRCAVPEPSPTGSPRFRPAPRRCRARRSRVPVYEGDDFPVQHRRHVAAHRAVLLQLDDRLPAGAGAELGDVGRLRARPRV